MAFPATFIPFQRAVSHLFPTGFPAVSHKGDHLRHWNTHTANESLERAGQKSRMPVPACICPLLRHLLLVSHRQLLIGESLTVWPARHKSTLSSNFRRRQSNTSPKSITRMSFSSSSTHLACLPSLPTSLLSREGSKPFHEGGQVFSLQGANDPG